eukprot:1052444-Alexandrium_andersonii.AAC.1
MVGSCFAKRAACGWHARIASVLLQSCKHAGHLPGAGLQRRRGRAQSPLRHLRLAGMGNRAARRFVLPLGMGLV